MNKNTIMNSDTIMNETINVLCVITENKSILMKLVTICFFVLKIDKVIGI